MGKCGCYEECIEELNGLIKHCPELKSTACKKLEKVIKELSFKLKVLEELEALKAKELLIKEKIHLKKEAAEIKVHEELEELKEKKLACEAHLQDEAEELKAKAEFIGQEINPVEKIKYGFLKFKGHFEEEKEYYEKLVECHKPKFLIFSCCDSRVDPFKILNLQLGEAIVVRNVANLVAPCGEEGPCPSTGAAIEYAIKALKVEHILVIGHSKCEGVQHLVCPKPETHFGDSFKGWLKIGEHSSKKVKESCASYSIEEQCKVCEKECVSHSLHNCLTYPCVKEAVAEKKLSLHAGYYDFTKCSFEHWKLDYKYGETKTYF